MKKVITIIIISLLLSVLSVAVAETEIAIVPATEPPTRELQLDDDDNIILTDADLAPETICQTIWAIIEDCVGENDTITEISIVNGVLSISVDWPESAIPQYFTYEDYAGDRISSVTDEILDYEELDVFWDIIELVMPQSVTILSTDSIVDSQYGRYFDPDDFMFSDINERMSIDMIRSLYAPIKEHAADVPYDIEMPEELQYGDLVSIIENPDYDLVVVKAKISPSYSKKATVDQNYYNIETLVQEYGFDRYGKIDYWAVADMTDGSEQKVVAFVVPHDTLVKLANSQIPANMLGDYVDDLWIHPSLK